MALVTSPSGVKAIQKHEGLVLTPYQDAVGVWTIGYGHTGAEFAQGGKPITKAKATELLKQDLKEAENAVNSLVKVPLSQPAFDSLSSLVFNIGIGAFRKSTLLKKLNEGDYLGAADEFPKWRKGGGKVLPGLVRRRADERAMFLSGTDIQETDDVHESNIEPEAPKKSVDVKNPGVLGSSVIFGAGGLKEILDLLGAGASTNETTMYIWFALGAAALAFIIYKSRKED